MQIGGPKDEAVSECLSGRYRPTTWTTLGTRIRGEASRTFGVANVESSSSSSSTSDYSDDSSRLQSLDKGALAEHLANLLFRFTALARGCVARRYYPVANRNYHRICNFVHVCTKKTNAYAAATFMLLHQP